MRRIAQRIIPALPKVLRSEFGDRAILRSIALFFAGAGFFFLTWTHWLPPVGRPLAVAVSGFELIVLWRLGAFEIFGQILCGWGVMQANVSEPVWARRFFLGACGVLADRTRAYSGLYQMAETKEAAGELAGIILAKERRISPPVALLLGRCLRDGGRLKDATTYFQMADRRAPSDSTKLELAEVHLATGEAVRCLQTLELLSQSDDNGRALFLRAGALRSLGRPLEALVWANRAVQVRPCDPDYRIEKGRILEDLGRDRAACHQYGQAIRVHPRNPVAFFRRSGLRWRGGDKAGALNDLERCYYYDNRRSDAYLLGHSLRTAGGATAPSWIEQERATLLAVGAAEFGLSKGESVKVEVTVSPDRDLRNCQLQVLEPFGGGLEVRSRAMVLGQVATGERRTVTLEVKAKRASEVNFNRPWILNVILTAQDSWASRLLRFKVTDSQPGRVFLVLTNDHEPQIHRDRLGPGNKCPVLPEEAVADLVTKARVATRLAEKYGWKWTLMLDAGTAIGLPKWAASQSSSWKPVYQEATRFYLESVKNGHDCEMHLHLKGLPASHFFCYHYDSEKDTVSFDGDKNKKHFAGSRVNSWANVTRRYGRASDVNSRVGSITHAAGAIRGVFSNEPVFWEPVLFRAGQWDLGSSVAEREKSIMALRECGVVADSSVAGGYNCYERPFQFGSPPARATYFTLKNNPEKRARRLVDAGIVQAVPIWLRQGAHPMTPRHDPGPVIRAYRGFLRGKRVAPGRHLIMEIEHFGDIRDGRETGARLWNDAWRSMEKHFADVRRQCPELEGIGGAEAILSWLDYYSPELFVRLAAPAFRVDTVTRRWLSARFPMRFLGEGILTADERLHELTLALPRLGNERPQIARVLRDGKVVCEARCVSRGIVSVQLELSERNRHEFALELERN